MILCIDIGNTSIAYSKWDGKKFSNINRVATAKNKLKISDMDLLTAIAISSVVPDLTNYYSDYFNAIGIKPFIVNHNNCKINLTVDQPSEVGPDRICNAVGAQKKYGTPCVIIDFGSATTYDIIDEKGDFIGGAIAPGIDVSANYLIKKAALLNETIFQFPENVIGKNTNTNLQSGIMYGGLDSVSGMIKRIMMEMNNTKIQVVLTGGFSLLISEHLDIDHILDETITLYGLQSILNANHE
tara:strand:- start:8744 stop:9466 length:723 start_codon:yes stop_codon:yes gene_type:complete